MDDYRFYIWAAFGFTAFMMLLIWLLSLKHMIKQKKTLKQKDDNTDADGL